MTLHVCRDFLTVGNPTTVYQPYSSLYLLACFLRGVLGYVHVGNTNFAIDGATLLKGSGAAGTLNQGAGNEFAFSPNGYTVSSADIDRVLAIKSVGNPMVNSGLFRVVAVDVGNNWLILNYRSGDFPPVETGLTWRLFASGTVAVASFLAGANGTAGTYQSQGSATASRVILQSPHSSGWQVRLSVESSVETASTTTTTSIAPGLGGNLAGDFPVAGQHLHGPLYFNTNDANYLGSACGWSPASTASGGQYRVYIWGDDSTGSVVAVARNVFGGSNAWCAFGLCEDEELPLPPKSAQRLFVFGSTSRSAGFPGSVSWSFGNSSSFLQSGMGFGLSNQPISAIASTYYNLVGSGGHIRNDTSAGDNPYLAATELLPVDVIVGTLDQPANGVQGQYLQLEGRRLGRFPIARLGRSNYGSFMTSTDVSRTWIHVLDGIFLPWQGAILP